MMLSFRGLLVLYPSLPSPSEGTISEQQVLISGLLACLLACGFDQSVGLRCTKRRTLVGSTVTGGSWNQTTVTLEDDSLRAPQLALVMRRENDGGFHFTATWIDGA